MGDDVILSLMKSLKRNLKLNAKTWMKTLLILFVLFVIGYLAPANPIDPWKLFSLKKIANLIFALAFVQGLGSVLITLFGTQIGAILTGFLGGLVSSTATTAALAKKSLNSANAEIRSEILTFLSATLAILIEALAITVYSTTEIHWSLLIIFSGPILSTLLMIGYQARHSTPQKLVLADTQLKILPILKLALFVLGILTLSKLLQNAFGQAGLLILTFIVSLFEIHGSVIANLQLHDSGSISVNFLGGLLAASIVASYCSKLFLVVTLGSPSLRRAVIRATLLLFLSLSLCGAVFYFSFGDFR